MATAYHRCCLRAILRRLWLRSGRKQPGLIHLFRHRGMSLEWEYAADVDFVAWNIFVNKAKNDNVHIFLANTSETNDAGNMLRVNEKCRSSKTLGSLLCSAKTRCILGNAAFRFFWKMWMRRPNIPLDK